MARFVFGGRKGNFTLGGRFGLADGRLALGLPYKCGGHWREFFQISQRQIRIIWINAVNRGVFLRRHGRVWVELPPSLADPRQDAPRPEGQAPPDGGREFL